jgi:Sec-independent protein translocase protein TatA
VEVTAARLQWAGLLIVVAGCVVLFGPGVGLVVFGVGVLVFGVAAEREAVTDGVGKPPTST